MHPLLGTWPATQACALTGNQTLCGIMPNPLSHMNQGKKQDILNLEIKFISQNLLLFLVIVVAAAVCLATFLP